MTSLLAGSLARTIGRALAPVFLPATLTRNGMVHSCRAIFDKWSPERELPASDGSLLILANTLDTQPASGDIVTCQGRSVLIGSYSNTRPAIATDAAIAIWTLNFKQYPVTDTSITKSTSSTTAELAGTPYDQYRPLLGQTPIVTANKRGSMLSLFAASKTGFNVKTALSYDTVLYVGEFNGTDVLPGDYFVGSDGTFFVAGMPHLLPTSCVRCNAVVSLSRNATERSSAGGSALPSQAGGTGRYFGPNTRMVSVGAGETPIVSDVPVAFLGSAGRATVGNTDLPADAPGPSRWRVHFPPSVCPFGFIKDRDLLTDSEGYRYQISAAAWTVLGYRCEAIRLES